MRIRTLQWMPPRLLWHMASIEDNVMAILQCLVFHWFVNIPYFSFIFGNTKADRKLFTYLVRAYDVEVFVKFVNLLSKRAFSSMWRTAENNKQRRSSDGVRPDMLYDALSTSCFALLISCIVQSPPGHKGAWASHLPYHLYRLRPRRGGRQNVWAQALIRRWLPSKKSSIGKKAS